MKVTRTCWSGWCRPMRGKPIESVLDSGFQAVDLGFLCQWDMDSGFPFLIIIIIIILLIARKLTFEYDQMRVTSKIPKNYKQKQ